MKARGFLSLILCFTILLCTFSSADNGDSVEIKHPETQARSYYDYFDTVSVIISYKGDSREEFQSNCDAVSELLGEYHKLFDIYYEYDGINNLKTVNKNAGKEPVKVDQKLIDFLIYCKEVYTLTNGKTNIALGSVLKLWHDEREWADNYPESAQTPSVEDLRSAAEHTDINSIVIDEDACTVFISDPKVQLDVGAIGKGYATERAAQMLIEKGVSSYILNIGGNIRAIGTRVDGTGWNTKITNPDYTAPVDYVCRVNIKNTALVTSGDYIRYYVVDGVSYHHIIDPETLMPSDYFRSVSIFVEDSGLADALSTALFCMSYEDGLEIISRVGAEAVWVKKDGSLIITDGVEVIEK